ncbi:GPN-loop GTPase 3-like [Hylaeus volcanicus]|uniref:GPN-loop GTPase 3-like n=1 Tax=Hylaeus volcanicus TaxID=313075 RepID=UPI0023B7987E|nr:GPN-loop GTPase 3-like [Hylaeus volcanicus]
MKFAQLVIGPAGCGKSTYCQILQEHSENQGKSCKVVNMDPAAEIFNYQCQIDIRDLICVDDVMQEMHYGPNGGLVYAMEYVIENLDWLEDQLNYFIDDDYVLFDCPGQIELYTHVPMMRQLVDILQRWDFKVCGVYCLDVSFITDIPKFIAGTLTVLSAMILLELPHVNVLTKCDLMDDESSIYEILDAEPTHLMQECRRHMPDRYRKLNERISELLEEYSLVSFVPLNISDEDSIACVAHTVNNAIQYGEDLEPKADFDIS